MDNDPVVAKNDADATKPVESAPNVAFSLLTFNATCDSATTGVIVIVSV